jgi:hypothetical protein
MWMPGTTLHLLWFEARHGFDPCCTNAFYSDQPA